MESNDDDAPPSATSADAPSRSSMRLGWHGEAYGLVCERLRMLGACLGQLKGSLHSGDEALKCSPVEQLFAFTKWRLSVSGARGLISWSKASPSGQGLVASDSFNDANMFWVSESLLLQLVQRFRP